MSDAKVTATIKAGTGYDVPWIVFHADSVQEAKYLIDNSIELLEAVSFLGKRFIQMYDSTPNGAAELIKRELGAEIISMEPIPDESPDNAPYESPTNTEPLKPWERATPAAPKPWENAGAPVPSGKPLVKLPYAEKKEGPDGKPVPGTPYALQGEMKNYFFQQRNKLNWNKERKGFEFTSHPTAELLSLAREWAERLGGSVEE